MAASIPLISVGLFLLQALVIITVTRVCARFMRKLKQPEVVGEVIGGILLGPSLLGLLWPASGPMLFPPDSLKYLHRASQTGLMFFMFGIGLETNTSALKKKARAAFMISNISVL